MLNIYLDLDGVIHKTLPLDQYEEPKCFSWVELIHEDTSVFIQKLRKLGKVNVLSKTFFPSSDGRHYHQEQDKIKKCLDLGFKPSEIIILAADANKAIFSSPTSILIDDYGENCKKWQAGGGLAIQFNEIKNKAWITCLTYNEVLHKIKKISQKETLWL